MRPNDLPLKHIAALAAVVAVVAATVAVAIAFGYVIIA